MSTSVENGALVAGRYRLRSLLGQGGMGRVWAAHDEVLERDVAVKEVLLPPAVPDAEREALLARTLREGRAAARVRHPRVVTVYDVVEDDDRPWLVLQLLEPRTLADVLAAEGPLDPRRAALIGLQLLEGLAEVHEAGVLHRDVKPANVLFGPDGGAVLADFGVATLEDDAAVTSTGLVLGSPAYLAPERARGEAPTPAADLWSLGATLFAAVEGRSPFHREGPLPTLGALLTEDVPEAPAAGPLAPVIAALLTKDPAARPDADGVRRLLTAALTATPAPALERLATVPVVQEKTAPMALPFVPAPARHEDWEVPATVLPARAAAVPGPRRRRRALVAVAAVALLAGPVTALAERHGGVVSDAPASAGTPLFSTTPKITAATPAISRAPGTAIRKTSSTTVAGHSTGATARPPAASLPRPASKSSGNGPAPAAAPAPANTPQQPAQQAIDGNGKGKDKHKKGDGDNGNGNGDHGGGKDGGGGDGNGNGGGNGGGNGNDGGNAADQA